MGMGGAMDSCGRCMKLSLICMNVVTLIGGAIAVAIGLWVWLSRAFSSTLMSNNMFIASVAVVVAMGVAMMLLSVLGCCGAAKEVKCMLLTYYILVFIMFVVMLVGGILQFVFREKVITTLDRELYAAIPYYGMKHEYTRAWDDTQTYLKCCGVRSYKDWNDNVPESCCIELYPGKVISFMWATSKSVHPLRRDSSTKQQTNIQRLDCKSSPNPTTMYMDGCLNNVIDFLREDALYVGAAAIVVALIMLLALILSCGLFVKIE